MVNRSTLVFEHRLSWWILFGCSGGCLDIMMGSRCWHRQPIKTASSSQLHLNKDTPPAQDPPKTYLSLLLLISITVYSSAQLVLHQAGSLVVMRSVYSPHSPLDAEMLALLNGNLLPPHCSPLLDFYTMGFLKAYPVVLGRTFPAE